MIHQIDDSNQRIPKQTSKSLEGKVSASTDSGTNKPKSVKKKTKTKSIDMEMDTTPTSASAMDTDDIDSTTRSAVLLMATSKGSQRVSKIAGGRGAGSSTVGRGKGRGGGGRGRGRGGRGPPSSRGVTVTRNYSMSSDDNNDNNDGVSAPVKKPKSMVNIRDIHSQSASAPAPARPKSVKTINGRGAGVSTRPVNRDSMSAPAPDNRAKSTTNFNSSHSAPLRPKSTKKLNGTHRGVSQNGPGSAPKRNPSVRPPARLSTSSMINMSASGDSLDPPPQSRRDSAPPIKPKSGSTAASNPKRAASFRAPSKPQSILRNSSHSINSGSSHGGSSHERKLTQSRSPSITRVNPDGSVTVSPIASSTVHPQAIPEDADLELNDMDPSFIDPYPAVNMTPEMRDSYHTRSETSVRLPRSKSMDESGHSQSSRLLQKFSLSRYQSTRSVMTLDREPDFEDDNHVQKALRYIRILPPHRDEKPIKRNIRIMTWVSLLCDMLAAFISIGTYDGTAHCCGEPILSIAGNFNWDLTIRITTYVYVLLIFAEILPVVLKGVPFNLLNPFIGFLITFAVFFDDRILEAVIMWVIEATAVFLEVACYRLKLRQQKEREERLEQCETDLKPFSDARKARKKTKQSIRELSMRKFNQSNEDESSESGDSFGNDSFKDENLEEPQDFSQVRELKLLRERRVLRQTQKEHAKTLHYHMIGVAVNVSLVGIAFLLIVCIGRSGGLCILDMQPPNVFKTGQLDKCFDCKGVDGVCEVCRDDGTSQCYYPYY
jgi:hypothetical protein